jgi:DNA-binding NarL/FixJ family response regulator
VILVVDHGARTRALLRHVLEQAGFVVRESADGHEALRLADQEVPEAVILEVEIPGTSAYVVCRQLRAKFGEQLPIIFTSGDRMEARDRTAGILLGADDYLLKPLHPGEMLARVQRLLLSRSAPRLRAPDRQLVSSAEKVGLTPRERELLKLLVDGLDQAAIAEKLVISPHTVATHIQRILRKLGVHSRAQAVARAAHDRLFETQGRTADALLPDARTARDFENVGAEEGVRGLSF